SFPRQGVPLLGSPRAVVVVLAGQSFVEILTDQDVVCLRVRVHQCRRSLPAGGDGLRLLFGKLNAHGFLQAAKRVVQGLLVIGKAVVLESVRQSVYFPRPRGINNPGLVARRRLPSILLKNLSFW